MQLKDFILYDRIDVRSQGFIIQEVSLPHDNQLIFTSEMDAAGDNIFLISCAHETRSPECNLIITVFDRSGKFMDSLQTNFAISADGQDLHNGVYVTENDYLVLRGTGDRFLFVQYPWRVEEVKIDNNQLISAEVNEKLAKQVSSLIILRDEYYFYEIDGQFIGLFQSGNLATNNTSVYRNITNYSKLQFSKPGGEGFEDTVSGLEFNWECRYGHSQGLLCVGGKSEIQLGSDLVESSSKIAFVPSYRLFTMDNQLLFMAKIGGSKNAPIYRIYLAKQGE